MDTHLIYSVENGSPADPVVVFLHARPLSSRMWAPQLEHLGDDFYCLAPDLPGHGKSQAEPFTLDGAARRVAELIHAKAPGGKATVVGLSLGGAVALTLLRTAPEVVERALVSGAPAKPGRLIGALSLAAAGLTRLVRVEHQGAALLNELAVPEQYRDLVMDDLIQGTSPAYLRTMLRAMMELELPKTVDCPLLVAVGEKETIPARETAKKLLGLYPSAQGIVLPGLHHLWSLENAALFSDTVRAWANGKPLPEVH